MKIFSLCGRLCDSQGIDFNGMREEKSCLSHWREIMSDVLEKNFPRNQNYVGRFWEKVQRFWVKL